jgi:hypothetical protein
MSNTSQNKPRKAILTGKVTSDTAEQVKRLAYERKTSISEWVNDAILKELQRG